MSTTISQFNLAVGRKHSSLSNRLNKVRGLEMDSPFAGRLVVRNYTAQVQLDSADTIWVCLKMDEPRSGCSALEQNGRLPSNVRFAIRSGRFVALADTRIDGEVHLPETLQAVRSGLEQTISGRKPRKRRQQTIEHGAIEGALDEGRWADGEVVEHEGRYEIRTRLRGEVWPVELTLDGAEVRVHRRVVSGHTPERAADAIAAEALRINARLRHARLSSEGAGVVAETRLHAGQISPHWFAMAARAVAMASRVARRPLEILSSEKGVVRDYLEMFGT